MVGTTMRTRTCGVAEAGVSVHASCRSSSIHAPLSWARRGRRRVGRPAWRASLSPHAAPVWRH